MTTVTNPDITHKRGVPAKFNPNSYRVMSEDVPEHDSIPFWYGHSRAPPLYTDPTPDQLPAQALEPRNNPHAARKVDMVYTNPASFNAPVGFIKTDNVAKQESRWWDWSPPKAEPYGPGAISQDDWNKTRGSSYRNAFYAGGTAGPYAKKNTRYSASPNYTRAVGIVPITELKPDSVQPTPQTLVEKVSFEQQYNSRNPNNYPLRGRRQGAFVIGDNRESTEAPDLFQYPAPVKLDRAASMWDLLHPSEDLRGPLPTNPYKYRRALPEIKRGGPNDHVWQGAPFANDYQFDPSFQREPRNKQIIVD